MKKTELVADGKISAYVGLAMRANSVLFGEDIICERNKYIKLVLIDSSASDKYVERLSKKLKDYPIFVLDGLRQAVHRDSVNAIAVTNENLANAIIEILR